MKKLGFLVASICLFGFLVACQSGGGGTSPEETAGGGGSSNEQETLKIFQFKPEIAEAINELAKEYEAETGVKVEVETVGGGADYDSAFRAKIAGGDEPDIFNNQGLSHLEPFKSRAMDLSDQPWVDRVMEAAKDWMFIDGAVYGMPMNLEVGGIAYNKDLFAEAGITEPPQTLAELREAMQKLDDAGILPIANGFGENWISRQVLTAATAHRDDVDQFTQDVMNGDKSIVDDPVYQEAIKTLDLLIEYGEDNPLTTDYNRQVNMFATGQAAMMTQGNWTQVQVDSIDPELNVGLFGIPVGDDYPGKVIGGVPNNWVVNTEGNNPEGAKEFLNWLVSSDTGKRYLVEEFLFIPALEGIDYGEGILGDIAESGLEQIEAGNMLSWMGSSLWPQGSDIEFGSAVQAYVAGEVTPEEFLQEINAIITRLAK